jgi:hypothetical protein
VFHDAAQREAAFRFVENRAIDARQVALASHRATARQCTNKPMVFVAVDQTSLSLAERQGKKFGRVGFNGTVHRGLFAMTGLAVDVHGTTLGPTALEYWVSPDGPCPKWKQDKRPANQRRSHLWRRAIDSTLLVMKAQAPTCRPWFQLDRGADFGDMLSLAYQQGLLVTVRACHDRAIEGQLNTHLWGHMKAQPVVGHMTVCMPARPGRPGRTAQLSVRALKIPFRVAKATKQRRTE